jgi:son of sevenless-like protein
MPQRLFVRARFDFDASDPSALSFRAGDLIEVITMLESGWWDGMLGETRGWFPSNFVEEVDVDEEEALGEEGYEGEDALRMFGGVGAEAALGMDDVLGGEWGQGAQGLDDLARHMMDEAARADDGRDFEAAAARVRARTVETVVEEEAPEAGMEADEFGVPSSHQGQDNAVTIRAGAANAQQDRVSKKVEPEDAWIPSLTPDGQVRLLILKKFTFRTNRPGVLPQHADR